MAFTKVSKTVLNLPELDKYYNETIYSPLNKRLEDAEDKILDLSIQNSYLMQRTALSSDMFIETYFKDDKLNLIETETNKVARLMNDNEWDDNWKKKQGMPDFKNAFIKQRSQPWLLEPLDIFDLDSIGQPLKGTWSKYDSVNNCYWAISNNGANTMGEITKISPELKDSKVTVLSRWFLPAVSGLYWIGIDCDKDGSKLWFVSGAGAGGDSKLFGIKINTDGTLGETGYTIANGGIIDIVNSVYAAYTESTSGTFVHDVVEWDATTAAFLECTAAGSPLFFYIKLIDKATLSVVSSTGTIVLNEKILFSGDTGAISSFVKDTTNNILWIKTVNGTNNKGRIVKINLNTDVQPLSIYGGANSNVLIKNSGVFESYILGTRDNAAQHGITLSSGGDLLEITSFENQKQLIRRAVNNALWAENEVNGNYYTNYAAISSPWDAPYAPFACMIENDRYYWTSDTNVTANEVDIFRFDTLTGLYKHARLIGQGWSSLVDVTYNPSTNVMYIMGNDATYEKIFFGDMTTFIGLMGNGFNATNTINITIDWGTDATGVNGLNGGNGSTNNFTGICVNTDSSILYITNITNNSIDTLSLDGSTYITGVYWLISGGWYGIAYKNGNIYSIKLGSGNNPDRIWVTPVSRQSSSSWYPVHAYQDPTYDLSGGYGHLGSLDFDGNDLIIKSRLFDVFFKVKTLNDPDVLQLQTYLNAYNVLLYSNFVYGHSNIAERTSPPESFSDPRDVPDSQWMIVYYYDLGWTELHLSEFLSGKSTTGKDRYDLLKIRAKHYEAGNNNVASLNFAPTFNPITDAVIDNDIAYISGWTGNVGTSIPWLKIINYKKGTVRVLLNSSYGNMRYNGPLSDRNNGMGWTTDTEFDTNLYISPAAQSAGTYIDMMLSVKTFDKNDASDYQFDSKKTFVAVGTPGGTDLLVVDWANNLVATPVKVYKNVFNNTVIGTFANHIALDGTLFGATTAVTGVIYASVIPVWHAHSDGYFAYNVPEVCKQLSAASGGYVINISNNSQCWKTASGEWRHKLLISSSSSGGVGNSGVALLDAERGTLEWIVSAGTTGSKNYFADIFDDTVWSAHADAGTKYEIIFYKKIRFSDQSSGNTTFWSNSYGRSQSGIKGHTRPRMSIFLDGDYGYMRTMRYSPDYNTLIFIDWGSYTSGLQFNYFPKMDLCAIETDDLEIDYNPTGFHYRESVITPYGE